MRNNDVPMRVVYAKRNKAALFLGLMLLLALLTLTILAGFLKSEASDDILLLSVYIVTCICGLVKFINILRPFVMYKRDKPVLRLYGDRLEYLRNLYYSDYDVYYFQDIISIGDDESDWAVLLSDGGRQEINAAIIDDISVELPELHEEIKNAYSLSRSNIAMSDSGGNHFRSFVCNGNNYRDILSKAFALICGITALIPGLTHLVENIRSNGLNGLDVHSYILLGVLIVPLLVLAIFSLQKTRQ